MIAKAMGKPEKESRIRLESFASGGSGSSLLTYGARQYA